MNRIAFATYSGLPGLSDDDRVVIRSCWAVRFAEAILDIPSFIC